MMMARSTTPADSILVDVATEAERQQAADNNINGSTTRKSLLLPDHVWRHVVSYLDHDKDGSANDNDDLRQFSEVSYGTNRICQEYLWRHLDRTRRKEGSEPQQHDDEDTTRSSDDDDGSDDYFWQELHRLDSKAAATLVEHFQLGFPTKTGSDDHNRFSYWWLRLQGPSIRNLLSEVYRLLQERYSPHQDASTTEHGDGWNTDHDHPHSSNMSSKCKALLFLFVCSTCILLRQKHVHYSHSIHHDNDDGQYDDYGWILVFLRRIVVGCGMAKLVSVGLSARRTRRRRQFQEQQLTLEEAAVMNHPLDGQAATTTATKATFDMPRIHSIAGDLSALTAIHHSPPTTNDDAVVATPSLLHPSVSTPNLHHGLLSSEQQQRQWQQHRESLSSSSHWLLANALDSQDDATTTRLLEDDPLRTISSDKETSKDFATLTPSVSVATTLNERPSGSSLPTAHQDNDHHDPPPRGCVGNIRRVRAQARVDVIAIIQEQRQKNFDALTAEQQTELSTALLDACTDDSQLHVIQSRLCHQLPLDAFYVGSDGTESCAIHTSAFHGSIHILEFLCRDRRGGCCDANQQDANGWTPAHFSVLAAQNGVEAVQVLARFGAKLDVVAVNGYTPLQWARRLQNRTVAAELERLLLSDENKHQHFPTWFRSWMKVMIGWLWISTLAYVTSCIVSWI